MPLDFGQKENLMDFVSVIPLVVPSVIQRAIEDTNLQPCHKQFHESNQSEH